MAVHLDYNSTTPVDPRVVQEMLPVFTEQWGDPSCTMHDTGVDAVSLVEAARHHVGGAVGRGAGDVVFTSGATEANNMVVTGVASLLAHMEDRQPLVLYGAAEHDSVIRPCRFMNERGTGDAVRVGVTPEGMIDLADLEDRVARDGADLVSVAAANPETGVINPVGEVARIAHDHGALVHCDVSQAAGKIPVDAAALDLDFMTFTAHKMYGPKGCGAVVATPEARAMMDPLVHGGGHQNGRRGGTLNVPGIVGFGAACRLIPEGLQDAPRQARLRDGFESALSSSVAADTGARVEFHGAGTPRLPNTSSFGIRGANAEDLVLACAMDVELWTGTVQYTGVEEPEPSPILLAMGMSRRAAIETVRMSLGRSTAQSDMDEAACKVVAAARSVLVHVDEYTTPVDQEGDRNWKEGGAIC